MLLKRLYFSLLLHPQKRSTLLSKRRVGQQKKIKEKQSPDSCLGWLSLPSVVPGVVIAGCLCSVDKAPKHGGKSHKHKSLRLPRCIADKAIQYHHPVLSVHLRNPQAWNLKFLMLLLSQHHRLWRHSLLKQNWETYGKNESTTRAKDPNMQPCNMWQATVWTTSRSWMTPASFSFLSATKGNVDVF